MVDTSILGPRIHERAMDICFNAIVCEAFINAVPISKNDRTESLTHGLRSLAIESVKDLGGHKLLTSACENENLDASQKAFVQQVLSICTEAATAVTDRIIDEHKDGTTEELADAADNIVFTEDECEIISKKSGDVCPEELSSLIQEKVLSTIKEEKEAYAKDAELEEEIKSAIMDTQTGSVTAEDGTAEEPSEEDKKAAYESYLKSVAIGSAPRPEHATVFSKLHELCYEGVLCATESYDILPFKAMDIITRECTFSSFASHNANDPMRALEAISTFATESLSTPDIAGSATPQETALLAATVIYALFETLHTMNIYSPKFEEIREFVDNAIPLASKVTVDKSVIMDSMSDIIRKAFDAIRHAQTIPEVEIVDKNLEMVREKVMKASAFEHERPAILEKLDAAQKAVDTKRDSIIESRKNVISAVESEMQVMKRTRDTLKFSRVASSFGRKPNVTSIRCRIDPQGDNVARRYVAVECFDLTGRQVNATTVELESALESDTLEEYVTCAVRGSNLLNLDKRISVTDKRSGKAYFDTAKP